jgi:hypothetical protein
MSRYALIEVGVVVEVREMPDNFDPAEVAHKFDWRIISLQPDPAFDPATQKLQGFDYVVNPSDVEATPTVVALNQAELDALAEQAERDIAKGFYQDLKDGAGNNAERLTRVETVAARLLKDAYGV